MVLVVPASEEVHHVIVDNGGMGVDVAEGIIVQEVSEALGPEFGGYVVAVDGALLVGVVLGLFLRDSAVDVKRGLVDYG